VDAAVNCACLERTCLGVVDDVVDEDEIVVFVGVVEIVVVVVVVVDVVVATV
jgi:hypothetical protein